MLIVPNKRAVVLKLRDTGAITTLIPRSKTLKPNLVAVKHGVEEVKILRNLGVRVPSPILYYYDWPGIFKPFAAQRVTADFLTSHSRAFVLNDLGTGKSLATLWAYDYLRGLNLLTSVLVVAPLSTMVRTWADEVFKHFPHLTTSVLYGSRAKRLKLLAQPADVYIVNHDGLEIIADALGKRPDINLVVVDEIAQVARNAGTDRWRLLNVVVNKQCGRSAWGLTGTPTPNAPTDAWAQCRLLVPSQVPPYFNRFREQLMRQIGSFLWVPRPEAHQIVKDAMQPSIRFTRDECVDLPPCLYETRDVQLSKEQDKAYAQMMRQLMVEVEAGQVLAVNEAVKVSKLVQIACGVVYDTDGNEAPLDAGSRLQAVLDIVEAADAKVIVFVPFVSAVSLVANYLTGKHVSVECIHGGVSKNERDRIFKDFQSTNTPRVLVAQPAAMSHGLTLTEASTIVWYAPVNSNETFEQANGRITRPGQKNNQFIVMLEGTPVERKMYDRLRSKQKMQGILLSMVKEQRK